MFYVRKLLLLSFIISCVVAFGGIPMKEKRTKTIIKEQIHWYNTLVIANAETDANTDIVNNTIKLFFDLGFTLSLITIDDKQYCLERMPEFKREYIGNGDVPLDKLQTTDAYKDAYNNAIEYAKKYNKVILDYYKIKSVE
jgi:hypothetical protein